MKKILLLLTLMTLLLSACGSETPLDEGLDPDMVATVAAEMMAATAASQAEVAVQVAVAPTAIPTEVVPAPTLSADFENAAPIQTQLIIGIYQLENTALAVTKDQANILYAKFLSLQTSMTNQTTITEEEINSLTVKQATVLSAEQIQAITDLQITQEIVMTTLQELGIESQGRAGGEDGGTQPTDGSGGPPQGGGGQGGGGGAPPTDGSGQPPQQGGGGSQTGTAPGGEEVRNNLVPPELIDAIITLLESKINS